MLIFSSPAKRLDFGNWNKEINTTQPQFIDEASDLVTKLSKLTKKKLAKTLEVSDKLAELNHQRFLAWQKNHTPENSKPALLAYVGDVFSRIDVQNYKNEEYDYAQSSLRIISGLYGILRPYDLIQPYRLEMKLNLAHKRKKSLQKYWSPILTDYLAQEIHTNQHQLIISAASNEYLHAIDFTKLDIPAYTTKFLQMHNGKLKSIMLHSKHARGLIIDYLIKTKAKDLDDVKGFNYDGYKLHAEDDDTLTFAKY